MKCSRFPHLKGPSEMSAPSGCTLTPASSLLLPFPLICPFSLAASLITDRRTFSRAAAVQSRTSTSFALSSRRSPSTSFCFCPLPTLPPHPSSSPFGCLPCLSSLCLSNLLLLPSCSCHISRSSAVSHFAGVRQRPRSRCNGGIFNKSRRGIRASGGGRWGGGGPLPLCSFTDGH